MSVGPIPSRTDPMHHPQDEQHKASLEERYRVLLDISRSLSETLSAEDLYHAIFRHSSRILETTGFYISLYDQKSDLATIVFYADQGDVQRVEVTYKGSESDVIRGARGSIVHNSLQGFSLLLLGEDDSEVTRSAISAPLVYKGRVIGAISAQSYRPRAYEEADLEILQGIADSAAVAIENARHMTELERRRLEAERVEQIGRALTGSLHSEYVLGKVASAVIELLEVDGSAVWFIEGGRITIASTAGERDHLDGEEATLSPMLARELLDRRLPVVLEDVHESKLLTVEEKQLIRARSALIVPLLIEDEVVGALSAESMTIRDFGAEEAKLLQRLASQGALSLHNARLHASLQALTLTDPLTGLPNRRHLQMHLEHEMAAARRGRNLSVVLFDLNNFKEYNDTLGHVAGDEALRALGRVLLAESRAMNLVARYGGDEFFSVLSETSADGAEQHAQRVLARLQDDPILSKYGMTMSYGVAECTPEMSRPEELIEAADQDMYRSKAARARRPDAPQSIAGPVNPPPPPPR